MILGLKRALLGAFLVLMVQSCVTQLTRRSFQTSDGVTLSFLDAGESNTQSGALTIVFVPGWSMPAEICGAN